MEHLNTSRLLSLVMISVALLLAGCTMDLSTQDNPQPQASEITLTPPAGDSILGHMAFSPDGKVIAVTSFTKGPIVNDSVKMQDVHVALYDARTGAFLRKLPGAFGAVEFNNDGSLLLVSANGLSVFDTRTGAKLTTFKEPLARFMHDGKRVVTQRLKGSDFISVGFDIHSATTGELLQQGDLIHQAQMWNLTVAPDDRHIVLLEDYCGTRNLYLLDPESGSKTKAYDIWTYGQGNGSSLDGEIVSLHDWDNGVFRFFESRTGKEISAAPMATNNWMPIDISNDHETFARAEPNGSTGYEINLRSIYGGLLIRTLATIDRYPIRLSFSSDGKTLAAGLEGRAMIFKL